MKPTFLEEKKLWRQGQKLVVGIDEVGRGCFAGPVVAAAVAFAPAIKKLDSEVEVIEGLGINDSKLLKPREREKLEKEIKKYALTWSVAEIPVSVINRLGMGKACGQVMRKAISHLRKKSAKPIDFVLVDGYHVKYIPGIGLKKQKPIINGDQKSISIAAASILAKVYRDKLIQCLSKKYPRYGWGRNKGYGTKEHQKAILRYGLTRLHRRVFVQTFLENGKNSGN